MTSYPWDDDAPEVSLVCSACGEQSCWDGNLMCDESRSAGTTRQEFRAGAAAADNSIIDAELVKDLALPEQIGVDVRLAVVDWTDPAQAAASASQARAAILRQVRELYQDKRDDRKPGKTATSGVTTSAQVAPELGFLAAASYALDAFADAVKAGSDEARGIAGDFVLEVQPEREVGTATVKVGTVNGTVKATRTQATKPSVDTERIVDILVADLISNLPEKSGSGETAAYAAGARAAIAGLLGVISPPSFKTTALDDWQRRLEANGEDDLAIRLAHAYGRVPTGDAKTKLTIEPAKAVAP